VRKISLFMHVSLDGYFEAPGHDISWARGDVEVFSLKEGQEYDTILLGHRTYDLMKEFWPTPEAFEFDPAIAKFMNESLKLVASHSSFEPGWSNVTVIMGDVTGEVRKLKEQAGKSIIIIGSNSLCTSLMQEDLVDEFQLVLNPVALGEGSSLFAGLQKKADLTLIDTSTFGSGAILLTYKRSEE